MWQVLFLTFLISTQSGSTASHSQHFLDLLVPRFEVRNATLTESLQALKPYGLRFGIELKPSGQGKEEKRFSLRLSNVPIREILNGIVREAGGYSWDEVRRPFPTNMVNIFPADPKLRLSNVMDVKVAHFEINRDVDPTNAIHQIGTRVPELAGRIGGSMGSQMTIEAEAFCIVRENISVRELLNDIALQKSGLGWIFRPVRDPSHPQRVYYSWTAF